MFVFVSRWMLDCLSEWLHFGMTLAERIRLTSARPA
jgi:hypothetical protein